MNTITQNEKIQSNDLELVYEGSTLEIVGDKIQRSFSTLINTEDIKDTLLDLHDYIAMVLTLLV